MSRITLAAIGRRAGVSTATVSKVLNGRPGVAPETRSRVQTVLDAYGYGSRPGQTVPPRTNLIDVWMIDLADPWAAEMLGAFARAGRARGVEIVPSLQVTREVSDELITRVLARGSRGVLAIFGDLSPAQRGRLAAHRMPCVSVAPGVSSAPAEPTVDIDFRSGIRAATEHLLDQGHRRIGVILGPRGADYSEQRFQGYRDALRGRNIGVQAGLVRWSWHDPVRAQQAADQLLDLDDPPTAIVAASDTVALGVYRSAAVRSLAIGCDLAVTGFDDRPESRWLRPTLTTVRVRLDHLAAVSIDLLLGTAANGSVTARVSGELVVRDSSASSRFGHRRCSH